LFSNIGFHEGIKEKSRSRSSLSRVALLLIFLFVSNVFSAAMENTACASEDADHVEHSHGAGHSCPDSTNPENGCSPSCTCTCCPGHLFTAVFYMPIPTGVPLRIVEKKSSFTDAIHSQDFAARIFRPPLFA